MTTRETLHCLIDEVPEEELEHVRFLIENHRRADRDPLLFTLATAPYDEPETPEEAAAVAEAREDVKAGRLVSREEARRRLLGRP